MLSGVVYYDANQNVVREDADWGIADAIVTLTAASNGATMTTTTEKDGSYTFMGLAADSYTITMVYPSSETATQSKGRMTDAKGKAVSTDNEDVSGTNSIANITLSDGAKGSDYDFALFIYPTEMISKRMLLNTDPGVVHATAVPEPSTLALLVAAAFSFAVFRRCRRPSC